MTDKLADMVNRHSADTLHVPVDIFSTELSPAEALVKYLKENKQLRYADIGRLLNRDQRGIWCTYNNAKTKQPEAQTSIATMTVPVSLFSSRAKSILEHLVLHLKETHTLAQIAKMLNKSPSTIATTHSRARKKQ